MNQHQRCFVEILASDGMHPRYELVNQRTSFGRHSSCTIQIGLDDLKVSNRHAQILIDGRQVFIEDLNSTNHVFVNNKQVTKTEIKHNDVIRFGAQGPQLCFIIENHQPQNNESSQFTENEIQSTNAGSDRVSSESRIDELDDSFLFSVEPDSADGETDDPVPEDTVRHDPVYNSNTRNALMEHLKADKNGLVYDKSKNPKKNDKLHDSDDSDLFSIAPDSDNSETDDPVPEDTVRHDPVYNSNTRNALMEHLKADKNGLAYDKSKNPKKNDKLHDSDDSDLFSIAPDSDNSEIYDPVPEDTVRHDPVSHPDARNAFMEHLKADKKNLGYDRSDDPKKSEIIHNSDTSNHFSVATDSKKSSIFDPVPEYTDRHDPVCYPDARKALLAHLKADKKNLGYDRSDDPKRTDTYPPPADSPVQNANKSDSLHNESVTVKKDKIENHDLFDVSPETDNHYLDDSVAAKKPGKITHKTSTGITDSGKQQDISIDKGLFDVSPDKESIEPELSSNISNTMEISSRLTKQMINSRDLDILVKNSKTREKILNNKNVPEQQKQMIVSVTDTYASMKRKYFIVFGIVILLLCAGIVWFATGYFSYKHQFSKARALKNQVATYDQLFETARLQDDNDNSRLAALYDKLQKVQAQFDSVKVTLELKDQQKIYSDTVEVFLDEIMTELNEKNYSIPQHMLERVKYYIALFTKDKRKSTEVLLKRRLQYFDEIEMVFRQRSVPPILGYVAMQESLLDTNAVSSAGAVGMWQFMESTGLRFSLVINSSIDERRDWRKSTVAAANYFRSLLLKFGDGRGVLLAIAAYNAGEDKIQKALSNVEDPIRDRDFWYLYRTSSILATETREYVPQVLARVIIDRNPELYGFK